MKRIIALSMVFVITCGLAFASYARTKCEDEFVCTAINGCRYVTICEETVPKSRSIVNPCRDEYICTTINGCRYVTICN
jgi:hypothetical protein